MNLTRDLYGGSLSLLTDLYQLTMAYGYWKSGTHEKEAIFNLFFRENPFRGGYTIFSGLEYVVDYLESFHFSDEDIGFLATLKGNDGTALFESEFLEYLRAFKFSCDIDAMPEGTVVFPHEPLIRVRGPIYQCQMIETPLLNMANFQTLIATKASRIAEAAKGAPVLEFGLRRAQGIDGALAASRSAYIGGCASTSNVMAGKLFNIPVSGTHAHSWVMSFDSELESFETYARVMPNNCVLLVDTYDSIEGIQNAIKVGKAMQAEGKNLMGIRIDSGDLAYFSSQAREMLDAAGLHDVKVVASNDLDEHLINSLQDQDAKINVWGIGTKLVTAYDQPALGAVYKLAAIKEQGGSWKPKIKLSEQAIKINVPGNQQVRRFTKNGKLVADMIYEEGMEPQDRYLMIDVADPTRRKKLNTAELDFQDLLQPVFRGGKSAFEKEAITAMRKRCAREVKQLDRSTKRLVNPHIYPVGLEQSLYQKRTDLILQLRKLNDL